VRVLMYKQTSPSGPPLAMIRTHLSKVTTGSVDLDGIRPAVRAGTSSDVERVCEKMAAGKRINRNSSNLVMIESS